QNVHRKGMDRQKGELLAASGKKMSPAEVGLAATVGKAQLLVSRLPSVVVISTGDELVEVNQQPLPHQIRRSNIHRLVAGLKPFGIKAEQRHLKDDLEEVIEELSQLLEAFDVLILSGGVSKGKYDYVPEALDRLKVEKLFHRVKQRPGKPFWFGVAPSGARVFALPGNPVSSFMCSCRYMLPWLRASLGQHPVRRWKATLASDIHFKPDLTYFAQVKLSTNEQGVLEAEPIEGNGSGDLANLVEADGFLELPRGKDVYSKGETHSFWPYRM
ncbi:MAG: molybdopterin molybdotransferase MoeA, partial [Bacteroidota bacterium]